MFHAKIYLFLQGWQFAVDFPATFYSAPGRASFARRRKWARYRKFVGFNQWILVSVTYYYQTYDWSSAIPIQLLLPEYPLQPSGFNEPLSTAPRTIVMNKCNI